MTENELKAIVIRTARNRGWLCYHVTAQKHHNGGDPGYPDLTLAREGHEPMWIELKQEKGKLTDEQAEWRKLLDTKVIRPSDVVSGYLMELLK
jgi:hypothetical protein